jgi:hypothetical protein
MPTFVWILMTVFPSADHGIATPSLVYREESDCKIAAHFTREDWAGAQHVELKCVKVQWGAGRRGASKPL